jgi:hypothetical protein
MYMKLDFSSLDRVSVFCFFPPFAFLLNNTPNLAPCVQSAVHEDYSRVGLSSSLNRTRKHRGSTTV